MLLQRNIAEDWHRQEIVDVAIRKRRGRAQSHWKLV